MDSETKLAEARKAAVKVYFEKIDAGNTDDAYFGLFTDDVVLYFPKFGFVQGKDGIKKLGEQLGAFLKSLHHDIDNFIYIINGPYVVVEGREKGMTKQGVAWPDNVISYGLFCNVFEFEGNLIKRVHIYVDPDFTSCDSERIKLLKGV